MLAQIITFTTFVTVCLAQFKEFEEEKRADGPAYDEDIPPPLSEKDLKCIMMSSDELCTDQMLESKRILQKSVNSVCEECPREAQHKASLVAISMIHHHSAAWDLFLSKYQNMRTFMLEDDLTSNYLLRSYLKAKNQS